MIRYKVSLLSTLLALLTSLIPFHKAEAQQVLYGIVEIVGLLEVSPGVTTRVLLHTSTSVEQSAPLIQNALTNNKYLTVFVLETVYRGKDSSIVMHRTISAVQALQEVAAVNARAAMAVAAPSGAVATTAVGVASAAGIGVAAGLVADYVIWQYWGLPAVTYVQENANLFGDSECRALEVVVNSSWFPWYTESYYLWEHGCRNRDRSSPMGKVMAAINAQLAPGITSTPVLPAGQLNAQQLTSIPPTTQATTSVLPAVPPNAQQFANTLPAGQILTLPTAQPNAQQLANALPAGQTTTSVLPATGPNAPLLAQNVTMAAQK